MNKEQRNELLCQALETELGGVQIYTTVVGMPAVLPPPEEEKT